MKQSYQLAKLSLYIGAALAVSSVQVSAIENTPLTNTPDIISANTANLAQVNAISTLKGIIANQNISGATGNENFTVRRQWVDALGKTHTHVDQTIDGIKVYGTSMIMHVNNAGSSNVSSAVASNGSSTSPSGSLSSGNVYAITGSLAVASPSVNTPVVPSASVFDSENGQVTSLAQMMAKAGDKSELAYIYLPETNETKLSWKVEVSYNEQDHFARDFLFYDVETDELLARHPQIHSAKSRKTYSLDNQSKNFAPGRLLCTDNQTCGGDAAAQRAHDGASKVYDYYQVKFGRDGIDGNGMTMISSVHLDNNLNNAFWNGSQMMYGDGDGTQFIDLTNDFDIIGHELTHGVTQNTANLVYTNASGALNEAWSDILGISAEAYKNNAAIPNWKLGGDAYTPNTPGDALRYMDNPTQDGYSKDYYPERISFTSNPTNANDYGGVHGNSGIANLAYVLLVQGGTHPRNKTTVQVPGIGLAKSEKIFYRALSTYMNQNTDFAGARTATAQAAQDLYGTTEKTAVETAWCAVGVGACPTGGTTPPTGNVLENGIATTNVTASTGQEVVYTMDVPAGATNISFTMSGGTGDADMYVKFGSAPTDSSYDCRPYKNGNAESCTATSAGGKYYVRVKAYSSFSGVSLTGKFTASSGGLEPINGTATNISVNKSQWKHYTQVLPAGYSSLTITMSGGTGDADLYVRRGAQSTTSSYDCRPYKNGNNETCTVSSPAAGTWYIDIRGYSNASGITLNVKANP